MQQVVSNLDEFLREFGYVPVHTINTGDTPVIVWKKAAKTKALYAVSYGCDTVRSLDDAFLALELGYYVQHGMQCAGVLGA